MKQLVKKIFLVLCISTILVKPITALAYDPSFVQDDAESTMKFFTFSDPLLVRPGKFIDLKNNVNNGFWHVNQGKSLVVDIYFATEGYYHIEVITIAGTSHVAHDEVVYSDEFHVFLENLNAANYMIKVSSAESLNVRIEGFTVTVFK